MKKCPNCGYPIENEQDKYCSKCGTKLYEDFKESQKSLYGGDLVLKPSRDETIINLEEKESQMQASSSFESTSIKDAVSTNIDLKVEKTKEEPQTPQAKQCMFAHPFSFSGRIRRLEYCLSYVIYFLWYLIFSFGMESSDEDISVSFSLIFLLSLVPALWFLYAQGAKRCHDRNNSGWYQLIPFYIIWMFFADGEPYQNDYGPDPKGRDSKFAI